MFNLLLTLTFRKAIFTMKSSMLSPIVLVLYCIACTPDADDKHEQINVNAFKVGIVTEITQDPTTAAGVGAMLARDEINAAGGINGHPIELIARDGACDSDIGLEEARKLIENFDIVALIGPSCSSIGFVWINELLPLHQIPAVATTTTSPDLTNLDIDDLYFRLQASDLILIDSLALVVLNDDIRKLGIIHRGGNDIFNTAIADGLAEKFEAEPGNEVVSMVSYPEIAEIEFSDYVTTLFNQVEQAGGMDGLAIIGFGIDTANISVAISREMQNRSISRDSLLGVYINNIEDSVLLSGSRELFNGAEAVITADISKETAPNLEEWRIDFNELFNDNRDENALGYDAMYLIALALQQGGMDASSTTSEARLAIKDNLRSVSGTGTTLGAVEIKPGDFYLAIDTLRYSGQIDYNGASGVIEFDDAGDINYGDFKSVVLKTTDRGLVVECLNKIRLFPSGTGTDNEITDCD